MPRKKWFKLLKGRVGTFHLVRYLHLNEMELGFKCSEQLMWAFEWALAMTVATTPSATHTEQQAAPYSVQLDLDKPSDDTSWLVWVSGGVEGTGGGGGKAAIQRGDCGGQGKARIPPTAWIRCTNQVTEHPCLFTQPQTGGLLLWKTPRWSSRTPP